MDKKSEYSVDDILLEYELSKGTSTSKKKAPVTAEFPAVKETVAPVEEDEAPVKVVPEKKEPVEEDEPVKVAPVKIAPVAEPQDEEEDTVKTVLPVSKSAPSLAKKEADTRPLGPLNPKKPVQKNVPVSTRTRVLTVSESEEQYHTAEVPVSEQLEGQLVMENFAEEPIDEDKLEAELRERRREKIDGFRIIEGGKSPFKLTGEEEETDPDEEQIVPEDDEDEEIIDDFNDYAEAEAIKSELSYRQRVSALAVFATAGMEIVLILVCLAYYAGWFAAWSPLIIVAFQFLLLVGIAGVNHRMIAGGLKSLVTLKADADIPAAVCAVLGLVHTAAQFGALDRVEDGNGVLLAAAAGLGIVAGRLGRQMQIMRIRRNFSFVGSERANKLAAAFVDDEKTARELGKPADIDGIPPVVYYREAAFLDGFLERSYVHDPADRLMRWFAPLVLGVALLCAVGYGLLFPQNAWDAPTVFVAVSLTAMPVWALFSSQRALTRSSKRTLKKGGMIVGWSAVEAFGKPIKAVIVDAGELFPKEQVKLHGIKTFSGTRIDEAITDAAAVVIAAGGPLAPIFKRLIENRTDLLREVDSLAYEQDMGLSGWVGGRRVLIGNRRLLANHGVDVPSEEYEEKYTKDGRNTVYLSTGGELSAMFVVSYLARAEIKAQLKALQKEHITLMVRTCDPNVTEALVCDVMELPTRSVEVMTASEGRTLETLTEKEKDQPVKAEVACVGRGISKLMPIVQCRRLRRGVWAGLVAQLAVSIGILVFAVFVSASSGTILRPDTVLGILGISGLLGYLLPRIFRT